MVIENFVGYFNQGWHLWSHRFFKTSVQALLIVRISIEILGVILTVLPLLVPWLLSLAAFNTASLLCVWNN